MKTTKMMNRLFYVMCFLISIGHIVDGHANLKEDFELERQLKILNKSPIKSIHTKSGYIVDCIDIYKQPVFDHQLLKNHTLQLKPSSERSVKNSPNKFISALDKVKCPKGTVHIRRTTKNDLIQGKDLFNDHILDQTSGRSFAVYGYLKVEDYYGVSGTTNVYNHKISSGQATSSAVAIQNGDGTNRIVMGWHVHPKLYNNDASHFFSAWTPDDFKSGCFNTQCPGFVHTDRSYYVGARIVNTSTYGSHYIAEIPLAIFQDEKTQNWWISVYKKTIRYFPASLFSDLKKGTEVGWGGYTRNAAGGSTPDPPIGSGHLQDGDISHSGYFSNMRIVNHLRQDIDLQTQMVQTFSDAPDKCYDVKYYGYKGEPVYCLLQFGGPGGACGT